MAVDDKNYPALMYNNVTVHITGEDAKALEAVIEYTADDSEWKDFMEQLEDNVDLEDLGYTDDDLQKWRDSGQLNAIPQEVLDEAPYTVYFAADDASNILAKFQEAQHLVRYDSENNHPYWEFSDWTFAVAMGDTTLGYNEWVHHNILSALAEGEDPDLGKAPMQGRFTPQYQSRLDRQEQARKEARDATLM